jgi:glucosyl-3-phosphoglycerate synthase
MSDFAQTGLITTLQRLNDTHLAALERDLVDVARMRPIALVLPCHGSELDRPALGHLVDELRGAEWLSEIVVSMNGLGETVRIRAEEVFAPLPQRVRVLWHGDVTDGVYDGGKPTGKGENVDAAFRLLQEEAQAEIFVTQDCDVVSFRRHDLVRLCYAVAQPDLGFRFAKAYYSRATDRLYGRVTRLFLSPLLHACVRVAGHQPMLSFLMSFRYPLAGEIALTRELAAKLPIAPGWSLELSMLCDVFRRVDPREVCQVDGGGGYDHKHQPAEAVVNGMAREIAGELFRQMATEFPCGPETRALMAVAYRREGELAVRRSAALARMNQLPYDEGAENALVATFAESCFRDW